MKTSRAATIGTIDLEAVSRANSEVLDLANSRSLKSVTFLRASVLFQMKNAQPAQPKQEYVFRWQD